MKKKLLISLYIIAATVSIGGSASAGDAPVFEEVYRDIAACLLSGDYPCAEALAERFSAEYPEEPAGPLFRASILQYAYVDYEDGSREDEFSLLLDMTERLAQKKLARDADDQWARYFIFSAAGLRGARASLSGRLLYGIVKGRSGAQGMKRLIRENEQFYDAYLLAGGYTFWKSSATEPVFWLPLVKDDREKGIAEVTKAIEGGILTGPLSSTVLIEMLLAYDCERAAELAGKLVSAYPSCRLFHWQLGEAYKLLERYEDAVRIFSGIAESMRGDKADDGSGELRCWWKLAVLAKSVGKNNDCVYYSKKIIELSAREAVARHQEERISGARRMIEELGHE